MVAWADGGGTTAARRPVLGRERVVRYLRGLSTRAETAWMTVEFAEINGAPAAVVHDGGTLWAVVVVEIHDDRVTAFHIVVNPAKLAFATAQLM
ncbi:hypothetical protein ITP53_06680 [Nonomuraea sp. K274]|uniref:RNA polymerase sigma-70 factor (ECF subfamily) n=1 Tax=Nonomuraea cypriaca TaxID=1187855 RepID=A0A931A377_9ACTN|nr:hypothetical protein [Nonomuraea cypriaca]MBF8185427.1 hypothetical protein [Nonomuraea cypriaca]